MKQLITILILVFNLPLFAQSDQFTGDYSRSLGEQGKHIIEYKLTLN